MVCSRPREHKNERSEHSGVALLAGPVLRATSRVRGVFVGDRVRVFREVAIGVAVDVVVRCDFGVRLWAAVDGVCVVVVDEVQIFTAELESRLGCVGGFGCHWWIGCGCGGVVVRVGFLAFL